MKKIVLLLGLIYFGLISNAQNKKALTYDDILKWNRITEKIISNDGNTIVYKAEPWKGDAVLNIVTKSGEEISSIQCGTEGQITSDSKFVIFKIKPEEELIRQLKFENTEKDDMPLKQLGIFSLEKNTLDTISNIKSYKVPKKWSGWVAYQTKTEEVEDTIENKEETKKESDDNGYLLNIRNLQSNEVIQFSFVTDYVFAKDSKAITFITTGNDKELKAGVYYIDLNIKDTKEVLVHNGDYKQLTINKTGDKIAFLADTSNAKNKSYSLFYWNGSNLSVVVTNNSEGINEGWELSEYGNIQFADNTDRIYFGTAPKKLEKDTTKLDEEIPQLDVWHWNEPVLYTEQLNTKEDDLEKTYLAVYHHNKKKIIQLEKETFNGIELIKNGDSDELLAWSNLPYAVQTMWEGYPEHHDFYLVDINTGQSKMFKKDCRSYPEVSPNGEYIYWYNHEDTTWNTFNLKTNQEFKITNPSIIQCADEMNDIPNLPDPYGIAAWSKNDEALLIYDRFDIWKVNPDNKEKPVKITDGRKNKISYRILDFENANRRLQDDEKVGIDLSATIYLKAHNEITRKDGYYTIKSGKKNSLKELLHGAFRLTSPIKAKDANVFLYTKETFKEFPDLMISENNFKSSNKISKVNPQQEEFLWGTKELYSWTSLDGQKLEGLLVKPANFDPNKQYPLIVNFYEKASQGLYNHQIPEAHRSTVDYHYYSSNGYIIFNPDVYYKEGYPGESAYNCVMSGITQLISEGFINENAIAAQGHSWGGYQVAYLATRTNLFAAIESGAPVVNMFSAYGGIRLWSGRNRSFQYEHTQSRIGKSIWESPLRYLENSPLFTADKITTPMLIMHNEDDGAVPFSQGVEFFIALRRMGKKAWLLNYNDADHWPTKVRDKYDFQIRLAQFFDHYLKGEPMPKWMKEGIPAVNKGLDLGY